MITKCIAILAVVAQINAAACRQREVIVATPSCPLSSSGSVSVALPSSPSDSSSNTAVVKSYVAKGKYPVALENCGPTPDRQVPVTTSYSTAPVQEKPTIRKCSGIPAPRVISHSCTCYKTIVRPRVHQQIITVPTVQRYIETSHKPVVDSVTYEAIPVNCGQSETPAIEVQSGSSSESVQVPQIQTVSVPQVQTIAVPQYQTVQVPQLQTVEIPQVTTVEVPQYQTLQVPQVQTIEVPQYQTVQIPEVRTVEGSKVQTFEIPQVRTVEVPQYQTIEVPQVDVRAIEVPRVQTVQVSEVKSLPVSKCSSCRY